MYDYISRMLLTSSIQNIRSVHLHFLPLFSQRCSQIRKSFSLVLCLGNSAVDISSTQRLQPPPSYFNNKYLFFIKAFSSIWPIYFSKEELIISALHSVYERNTNIHQLLSAKSNLMGFGNPSFLCPPAKIWEDH